MPSPRTTQARQAFGRALLARRRAVGVSQEALALEAGLSPTFVAMVERGEKTPTLTTIMALSRVLHCSAWEWCATLRPSAKKSARTTRS
jgi:transcriptional regulator with XRE-family HTH domain